MLKIALSPPVHDAILSYFQHHHDDEIALNKLSAEQWETLRKIYTFLNDVVQMTKALESNKSSLNNIFTAMDYVLDRFKAMKEQYKDNLIIASMVNSRWSKMEKYYNLIDESPTYIIALVLNPSMKWTYIQQ
jgi:signal transduction histidine kinase